MSWIIKRSCCLVFLALFFPLCVAALAEVPTLRAVSVSAVPHDSAAFTQGLLYVDGSLYESTGLYGQSSLRRLDPATGRVTARNPLPAAFFGEGMALAGGKLYQLTWREGRVLVWDMSTLRPVREMPLSTEGWGACFLDGHLAVSDGSDHISLYDSSNMALLGTIPVTNDGMPVTRLNELELVGNAIWANVWGETRIAVIDPATGHVVAWVDCDSLAEEAGSAGFDKVLNGIAFDAATGRIWVTGKNWPKIHQIKVPGLPLPGGSR